MSEETEVIEVDMNDYDIEEVIGHLSELRENKSSVQFSISSDVELLINYSAEIEDEQEEAD